MIRRLWWAWFLGVCLVGSSGCCSPDRGAIHRVVRDSRTLLRSKHVTGSEEWIKARDVTLPNLDRVWLETGGLEADASQDLADGITKAP